MKTFSKMIGILAIATLSLSACKKEKTEEKKTEQFSVAMKVTDGKSVESAVVIGSMDILKESLSKKEGPVYLKKVAKANNVFIPIVGEGPGPVDPRDFCREEIDAYVAAHQAEWQQAANQSCTTIMMCLTCPNAAGGLYVTYIIKPTSPRCNIATSFEAQFNLAAFNYGNDQLESEAVAAHIKNR